MQKFVKISILIIASVIIASYLLNYKGTYMHLYVPSLSEPIARVEGKNILLRQKDGEYSSFELRGVDMGTSLPAEFSAEYSVTKSDYLRWFEQINQMGANTVRVYTLQSTDFYEAVYDYNKNNKTPLYLLQGIGIADCTKLLQKDPLDNDCINRLIFDAKLVVDAVHGKRISGSVSYAKYVSPWVLGYIFGDDWEDMTVVSVNEAQTAGYQGEYMYTSPDATAFEAVLAKLGDSVIKYETDKYSTQRLVGFSNSPQTDPFEYSKQVKVYFRKSAQVDMENIKTTDSFKAGSFAAYSVYPYYPDYLRYEQEYAAYKDENGQNNTYRAYLEKLAAHHNMPLVISAYGVPSSRGMSQRDANTGRNQGGMSETRQAEAVAQCYNDIKASGCAGSIVYMWQDDWDKSSWNTMHAVDLSKTPYWSDYQTSEQHFGLLAFDPGASKSVCYVDGNNEEWQKVKPVSSENDTVLKMMYDEKFVYFLVSKPALKSGEKVYIPIDTTPKSGALHCDNYALSFDRAADFVIALDGESSRVVVQERYCTLRAMRGKVYGVENSYINTPPIDSTKFCTIDMVLQTASLLDDANAETYETGKLISGNANPIAHDYNSLADYCYGKDCVEIKIPWQLINFSDPSDMKIHDDYYKNYGVEHIKIDKLYAGVCANADADEKISLNAFSLNGWGSNVKYHERLKPVYYALQKLWA